MKLGALIPGQLVRVLTRMRPGRPKPSASRVKSNAWLRDNCAGIRGRVLSIGTLDDSDGQGGRYRDYFPLAQSYTTSEVDEGYDCDLIIDVRSMPQVESGYYDCIFCSGVLEHVDDFNSGVRELTRVTKPGGILLLGLPFRQAIHLAPNDFWRFTEYGIRFMLKGAFEILDLAEIDKADSGEFPAAYWVKARKL